MSNVNNSGWTANMNAWLQQPGQGNQANVDAVREQAKAIGVDPGDIRDAGSPEAEPSSHKSGRPAPTSYSGSKALESDGTPGPAGGQYDQLIEDAAKKYNVPIPLIRAVIEQESGGDPNAVNDASGCTGLMQLKPEYFGQDGADLKDPAINIDRGTQELARLYQVKGGDMVSTLAAYNLGEFADIDSTVPGQHGLTGRQYANEVLERYDIN